MLGLRRLLTGLAAIAFLLGLSAKKRPNFLFIIVDDQSPFDLRLYNSRSILDTPNIDRLAKEGMVLDGAYHMGAWVGGVCTPSRHMVMSGRTVWHVPDKGGRVMNPHVTNPKKVRPTWPSILCRRSSTRRDTTRCYTCKNGNSYEAANKLFTVRNDGTRRGGTDETGSHWHGEQVMRYLNDRVFQGQGPFSHLLWFFSSPRRTGRKTGIAQEYGRQPHRPEQAAARQPEATTLAAQLVAGAFRPRHTTVPMKWG